MFTGLESPWHILIVLVIAVIVFGPKRLPELGRSLGSGIRGFKDSLEGKEEPQEPQAEQIVAAAPLGPVPAPSATVPEPESEAK